MDLVGLLYVNMIFIRYKIHRMNLVRETLDLQFEKN
jgi:hypothetical protein